MPAASAQQTPSQEAGRPQPQTTVQPQGGPFIRHAQEGRKLMYTTSGVTIGNPVTQPLVSAPGYLRCLRLRVAATGGSASATTSASADFPWNVFSLVNWKDAFGTPLAALDGYSLYQAVKWGGQMFANFGPEADPVNWPSFAGLTSASGASSGNFSFALVIPAELVKGVGVISMANSSVLPSLQFTTNPSSTLYATAPGTLPTLELDLDADFYWLPDQPVAPPSLGTTEQWALVQGSPTVGSAATATVTLPRGGGFLSTLILILRDSTNARIDAYGTRIQFVVDGVPLVDTRFDTLKDDMWGITGGMVRDTGVIVITRKTSLGRSILGLIDTLETTLSTSPGTSIAINCSPWGTVSNAPATLNAVTGYIVPAGAMVFGLPEA